MNQEKLQNPEIEILCLQTLVELNELEMIAKPHHSVSQASSPLSFFSNDAKNEEKAFIFKCFLSLDDANQLLIKEKCRWLLRETKIPGVIALNYFATDTDSFHIRRYAYLDNEWILIGNDMDALERHLINTNPSGIKNHEQYFFDRLKQDGFDINEPGFLAPKPDEATHSLPLRSLSRGPSPF